jgi:antitoxin (DNA-binding transcriptional repressor) of toxin-antitoxin stability system
MSNDEHIAGPMALGEGDSILLEQVLSAELVKGAFERLLDEVVWEQITQQGRPIARLVASQGEVQAETGARPIYRKPLDAPPQFTAFTPTIAAMCAELRQRHPHLVTLNHCYLQLYQDGNGFIGSHSDKSLDIARGSDICNLTLYAVDNDPTAELRHMVLERKGDNPKMQQCVPLTHNSALLIGPRTNAAWVHGVPRDPASVQRHERNRRMSLVFRTIATFAHPDGSLSGQGAPSQEHEHEDEATERARMFVAFGAENRQGADFDWAAHYGSGFACPW